MACYDFFPDVRLDLDQLCNGLAFLQVCIFLTVNSRIGVDSGRLVPIQNRIIFMERGVWWLLGFGRGSSLQNGF